MRLMKLYSCYGFHGTNRENADKILKKQQFFISKGNNQWLGDGVYFFENDIKQAYYWCVKVRKYQDWAIIKSYIEANFVLDLTDLKTFEEFKNIANKIINRSQKMNNNDDKDKNIKNSKLKNAIILNALYEIYPFDAVRAIFKIPRGKPVLGTNIFPIQIQICVKNLGCIKNMEEVFYDEDCRGIF